MTVETEVANLTTAVDTLTAAVNVKKATLDASVADAETHKTGAQAAQTGAEAARDGAALSATQVATTAAGIAGFDLNAIAESKAITAVDVFIYDTSKDSDGGAWRHRCAGTSWFNETLNTATRGSRREFPAVAVIVAEATKVTIYDGDDPALPMWMVFNQTASPTAIYDFFRGGRTPSSVSAKNGQVCFGTNVSGDTGLHTINLTADDLSRISATSTWGGYGKVVANRNSSTDLPSRVSVALVNGIVNDVAMAVLPDAPVDLATGLPLPTIAVATAGGISVIRDDGTVVNSASTRSYSDLAILDTFAFHAIWGGGESTDYFNDIRHLSSSFATSRSFNSVAVPKLNVAGVVSTVVASIAGGFVQGTNVNRSLNVVAVNPTDVSKSSVAYISSTYNTGWMNGDIKGAFLSSTDTASLVGSGELVTNGDFATNDLTGWTDISLGTGTVSASTGAARLTGTDTSNRGWVNTSFSTVVGRSYVVTFEVTADAGGLISLGVGTSSGSVGSLDFGVAAIGVYTKTFVASATTMHVNFRTTNVTDMTIDNISVKLADEDRSVNNKGLIVNGTVTRSPVATGAELVAYSGFSTSNYLEQPYNSDLDFGTGDFCVMGWSKTAAVNDTIIERWAAGGVGARILVYIRSDGKPEFVVAGATSGSDTVTGSGAVNAGAWRHICALKRGTAMELYVDGVMAASKASIASVGGFSNASAVARVGARIDGTQLHEGLLALLRISATAPTAEQIARIYQDEKALFQENAACTLYGSSDAVTALAHDPVTDLLHVGTSAGRSDFQGLRRVSNTTTAVSTAISANDGLIVEQ